MANIQSAKKRWRQNIRRRAINKISKSTMRSYIKKTRKAIQNKDKQTAQKLLPPTFSVIDKAVKKGSIHKNKGNRYKSRLSRQVETINISSY